MSPLSGASAGSRLRPVRAIGAVALVGLLVVVTLSLGPPAIARNPSAALSTSSVGLPIAVHMHGLPIGGGSQPLGTDLWYSQAGATLSAIDGSTSANPARLSERVTLVNSPYATGYELNGLSTSGDWYQIVVADNWPGCNAGFEEVIEIWNNAQSSGPVTCDSTLALASGDLVEFNLSFSSSSRACLDLADLSARTSHQVCQSEPDTGATAFSLLSSSANSNGYYSGPMTETVNTTPSSCPTYSFMPTVSFEFVPPTWISEYVPWSDEFDFTAGTTCYSSSGGVNSVSGTDPSTAYLDTASGTGYGPHWSGAQNDSFVQSGVTFRYQTDPVPINSASITASSTLLSVGQTSNLTVSVSGGRSPYRAIWMLNGTLLPGVSATLRSFRAPAPGDYYWAAYGVDRQGDVLGPTAVVHISVPGALRVGPVDALPNPGSVDVAQPVTFAASVSGGVPPRTYVWSGLPAGCASINSSTLTCAPSSPGSSSISLRVTDSNGSVVQSASLTFQVYSDPTVTLTATASARDVYQSITFRASAAGGSGGYRYGWEGLPTGCAGSSASVACRLTSPGSWLVQVNLTDSDGYSVLPAPAWLVTVNPAMSVQLVSSRTVVDAGLPTTFIASVTGGTANFTYNWSGLPLGCPTPIGRLATCTATSPGIVFVAVSVNDGANATATSATVALPISPAPSVTLVAAPGRVTLGGNLELTASASGGSSPLKVTWNGLPDGCVASANLTVACAPTGSGTFVVGVMVYDLAGGRAWSNVTVVVAPPGAGAGLALDPLELLLLLAFVVVVAAVIVALAARRRRRV